LGLASGSDIALVACVLGAVCVICVTFCYLLIARPEVAPRLVVKKGRVKLRFERLPKRPGNHDPDRKEE
jgi:hypothetical protein